MRTEYFSESVVEEASLAWLGILGYQIQFGSEVSPGENAAERDHYRDAFLLRLLRGAIYKFNPAIPSDALEEALHKLTHPESPSLLANNRAFHRMLTDGVPVEYRRKDGSIAGDRVRLIDVENPKNNDFLAVNQFTIVEGRHHRRPDIVIFVNGLPLAVIELKNPADEDATIWTAFNQLQTYKQQIPSLFAYNEALVISDGLEARLGTLTSDRERFSPWKTIDGEDLAPATMPQLEVLIRGVFEKRRFLDLIRHFIVFDDRDGRIVKKMTGYHQFHAVQRALDATIKASSPAGDRRCGVVWHTQGSGKSLTMAFYAGRVILEPAMENPTIVVITDRNDLDDQLFGTFAECSELLRQTPVQAESREDLQKRLQVASGGVIFTTVQKFFPAKESDKYPQLSDRRNIIVIADEAHRSQYDFIDGFARHMRDALPNASFIGFTGTPLELTDKNTRAVFGDYIKPIYDIRQAVEDGATVPIYYESRLAKLGLDEKVLPHLDSEFEEVTEGEELESKETLKTKWAALREIFGTEKCINLISGDIVEHFERRIEALEGKAMIVCMSREICVGMYDSITKIHPEWCSADDDKGAIKIVMTGSASDPLEWQGHIRNKQRREEISKRFKNPEDPLKIVIVRDMWLTGFDVPCLHTMYVIKPMQSHGLMQAIARVNRVYKDKPGGLIVDYIGLAPYLKSALANYTQSGGTGKTAINQEEAVDVMMEKYEICVNLFHGFDMSLWAKGTPSQRLSLLPQAQEHILKQEDGKARLMKAVADLSKAFALAVPHEASLKIRDDVGFFQAVRSALAKSEAEGQSQKSADDLNFAIRQLVTRAVTPDGVVDIFAMAGLKKPEISILSEDFLAEVREMPQKNLAVELLRKLLNDEIKIRSRKNLVLSRSFAEMLQKTVKSYQNKSIETVAVIEELIDLARELREASRRGEDLGLSEAELAFYDALEVNDSAVKVLDDETLKQIARELVESVRKNLTIDWSVKESSRAKLRVIIRRLLRKHGYPPDKQEKATQTVLEQAELLCKDWVS
jgi:type I restriction enzyme, R subunit